MKRKHRRTYFPESDLEALLALVNAGLGLAESLRLIRDKKNNQVVEKLLGELNQGEVAEEIFAAYLKEKQAVIFSSLLTYLPFKESLSLLLAWEKAKQRQLTQSMGELVHPLLLLAATVALVVFFNSFFFDSLIGALETFGSDLAAIIIFKEVLTIVLRLSLFSGISLIFILFFLSNKHRIVLAYSLLQQYWPRSMFKEYCSAQFINYYLACLKAGLKTKESIQILKSLKQLPLVSFIAFHLDAALLAGKDLKEALKNPYLDYRLVGFVNIAVYAGNVEAMLEAYLNNFQLRFTRFNKHLAKGLELVSYALIGLLLIFVYQILFIPMTVIGGMQ